MFTTSVLVKTSGCITCRHAALDAGPLVFICPARVHEHHEYHAYIDMDELQSHRSAYACWLCRYKDKTLLAAHTLTSYF